MGTGGRKRERAGWIPPRCACVPTSAAAYRSASQPVAPSCATCSPWQAATKRCRAPAGVTTAAVRIRRSWGSHARLGARNGRTRTTGIPARRGASHSTSTGQSHTTRHPHPTSYLTHPTRYMYIYVYIHIYIYVCVYTYIRWAARHGRTAALFPTAGLTANFCRNPDVSVDPLRTIWYA